MSSVSCSSSDDDNQSNVSQDPEKLALVQEGIRRVGIYEQDINQGYLLSSVREQEKQMVEDHLHWIKVALYRLKDDLESDAAAAMLSVRVNALSNQNAGFQDKDNDSFRDLIDFFRGEVLQSLNLAFFRDLFAEEFNGQSLGGFSNVTVKSSVEWKGDAGGYAKVTAFGQKTDVEAWLISPVLDLTGIIDPAMTFRQAVGFLSTWDGLELKISTNFTGGDPTAADWDVIPVEEKPEAGGQNWQWKNSEEISLDSYIGKKIAIAFHYVAPQSHQPTWEIEWLRVKGVGKGDFTPIPLKLADGSKGGDNGNGETPAPNKTFVKRLTPGAGEIYYKALEGSVADLGFKEISLKGKYVWRAYKDKNDGNRPVGLSMSGFNDNSGDNHDWLISPVIDLSNAKDPYLQIVDRIKFLNNNPLSNLKVKVSNNYKGDPEDPAVTWELLNIRGNSPEVDKFVVSGKIPLKKFIGDTIVIGFEYEGTSKASISWAVAEILVSE